MNALAKIHTPACPGNPASKKPVVLVVEDERTQRMILRAALERDGFEVEESVDGLDGLQAFDRIRPDIVLMDVRMPGMDGFAACAALRRRPDAERVPILMLTILNDLESINRAYEAGATDFITKPVAWPVLGHRLRYMLRASKAFNELARSETELLQRVAERTAELDAANAELEAFTYSVSHDLRAPLRAVRGFAEMLKGAALDAGERELLEHIFNHTQHMSTIIDDLLRLSLLARGSDLSLEPVDLASLAARTVNNLRADYPRTAIRISGLPCVRCDAGLMQQVFENLIGNALKYSAKQDTPEIEIGMDLAGAKQVIRVRDNGVGFDLAQAPTLFGAFRRFHAESDFPGTGVGLAIVKRVVERHGGRVWAQSSPGAGSTFYFTLGEAADMAKPAD
jgi:signal transduction histidine kinase